MRYITKYSSYVRIRKYKTINLYLDGYGILTSHKKWKSILDKLVNLSNRWYILHNQFDIFTRELNDEVYYFVKFYITDMKGLDSKVPDDIKAEITSDLLKISNVCKYTNNPLYKSFIEAELQLDVRDVPVKAPWFKR